MMDLTPKNVLKILESKCGLSIHQPVLVAVSGGADSMALLHLLKNRRIDISAAHCNFNLRGEESDGDQQLVEAYCAEQNIPLSIKSFDTTTYAREHKISIEMAARDLRYNWFNELMAEKGVDVLLTAHHGNDSIETFFLNLVRGTGVKGLSGIQHRNGNIVRPLLDFSRNQIEEYCLQHEIAYRNDSSNSDVKYLRNKIRHEVIPVLEQMNPSFFSTMLTNMEHVHEAEMMLEQVVQRFRDEVLVDEHDRVLIPISKLHLFAEKKTILFEVLRPYGFNTSVVEDVLQHLDGESGKQFFSETHRLIKDRHNLLVLPNEEITTDHFWLEETTIESPIKVSARLYKKSDDFQFSTNPKLIHLDADLVDLPLLFRKWEEGDRFMPLGMMKFKKISDYFIDNKFSLVDKEQTWLVISGEDIVWIAGHRIDDRFKITKRTKVILEIKLD
nr:tRNA lysidine(34) synthetase TilS [uncultured Carboxylicivirga sp.]